MIAISLKSWGERALGRYHLESLEGKKFYFLDVKSFKKKPIIFSDLTYPIELPPILSQDIDNEEDWEIAEFKYKFLEHKKVFSKTETQKKWYPTENKT